VGHLSEFIKPKLALHFEQWTLAEEVFPSRLGTILVLQLGQNCSTLPTTTPISTVELHLGHFKPKETELFTMFILLSIQ